MAKIMCKMGHKYKNAADSLYHDISEIQMAIYTNT